MVNYDSVGWLRNQAAFCPLGEFVEVRSMNERVAPLVEDLVVSRIYQDTNGKRNVLVIEVSHAQRAKGTVGMLRTTTAMMSADDLIEVRASTYDIAPLVVDLAVARSFPDTVNKKGEWQSMFVIELTERVVPA